MTATATPKRRFLNIKTLLGIAVSLLGLWLGFRKFDAVEFMLSLKETNVTLFLLAMLVMVFQIFLRAIRWRYLILPLKPAPLSAVFGAQMVCYFGNHVFPLRFGEILRSYALNKTTGISTVSIFGTVVIERLLDVLFFMVLLPITILAFFPVWPEWMRWSGAGAAGALCLFLLLLLLLRHKEAALSGYFSGKLANSNRYRKLIQPIRNFIKGLRTLRQTPHLGMISLMTMIVWVMSIFNVWVTGTALNVFFSFQNLLLLFFVTSAIIAVPSAPGYVGTYHAGAIGILLYMGYELSQAQAIAVILHAVGFISLTSIGFAYFIKYHIHVKDTETKNDINQELGA
ncbi:flippase-like domain-containing protein [bacterium]|nr:flippase-like domain-containing protein [bacterium]MBU1633877.1 flippase-like domain-containing protein [bacterium]MBU1872964.1 flippase-like domain-containing protein [bacterium]